MQAALITGATSGIGHEFARLLALQGYDLIVTGTNQKKLDILVRALQTTHGVKVHGIAVDLASSDGAKQLVTQVAQIPAKVTLLINNAGMGMFGESLDQPAEALERMLTLNILSLVTLSREFAKTMAPGGKILNVASIAAYLPLPYQGAYAASKAFVLSFSEALNYELRPRKIQVSCLSPGVTKTEFFERAGLGEVTKGMLAPKNRMDPAKVARYGLKLLDRRKISGIPGFYNRFNNFLIRLFPRPMVLALAASATKQSR